VHGGKNVEAMFRKSKSISSDKFTLMALENLDGCDKKDVNKFAADKSGRLSKPAPGWEDIAPDQRLWAVMHDINHTRLMRIEPSVLLAEVYERFFNATLEGQPRGEWAETTLHDFLRSNMGRSACITMCGERCLEIEPKYLDKFWEFDSIAFQVVWGMPKWLNPKPTQVRDEYNRMSQHILKECLLSYDWEGPAAQAEWEPILGSRYVRSLMKAGHDRGFSLQSLGGMFGGAIFG
jgi:hypothetical protein